MEVETYEALEKELGEHAQEMAEEALELIEVLGLSGQQSLLRVDEDEGDTLRNPYRKMTAEEERVYGVLCEDETVLEEYDASPIPLRVLQVAAHAKAFFNDLKVLHPKQGTNEDPVLIGILKKPGQYGEIGERFILARWGGHLRDLGELRAKALVKWKQKATSKLKETIAEAEANLKQLDALGERHLDGEWVGI